MKTSNDTRQDRKDTHGMCECGVTARDWLSEWSITPTRHMRLHGAPAPEDHDATIPGYRHGQAIWTPVCYAATADRYTSRDYGMHLIRLARTTGRGTADILSQLQRKFALTDADIA